MRFSNIVILLALFSLGGCVISVNDHDGSDGSYGWKQRQERNERAINHLELGRSRVSIESQMGDPDFVESFVRNGNNFTVLYYRTRRTHDDGQTTRDETTPLVFVDGKLVGWGDSAIDHATAE